MQAEALDLHLHVLLKDLGENQVVHDAACKLDETHGLGQAVEVEPHVGDDQKADERQNEVPAHVVGPLLVEEVPDDGEVQHHEGSQCAEVDQTADGVAAELLKNGHKDDGEDTHEQSRHVGGLVGGMDLGQSLGHHAVARHSEEDAADGGLDRQRIEDTPRDGGCQGAQAYRNLPPAMANCAVARELACWCWALGCMVEAA